MPDLRPVTSAEDVGTCLERRQGGGEWALEVDRVWAAQLGLLFHYHRPHADIYMKGAEPFRRRGVGSHRVQELKREGYQRGAIPAAR